jgi:hypothetical protein
MASLILGFRVLQVFPRSTLCPFGGLQFSRHGFMEKAKIVFCCEEKAETLAVLDRLYVIRGA